MSDAGVPVLTLQSGLTIQDPLGKVRRFCDGEYALYDAVEVARDSTLTVHDILLSVAVNSGVDAKALNSIWHGRRRLEQHLALIEPELDLADADAQIPWDTIARMFEEFDHIRHAKLAVGSKILHKKRPALIPMMDEVVRRYYESAHPDFRWSWKCGPLAGQLMRHFREDLLAARSHLEVLASSLAAEGHRLTPVRLLEMLIWTEKEPRGYYRR
jgi:hypothetical protein